MEHRRKKERKKEKKKNINLNIPSLRKKIDLVSNLHIYNTSISSVWDLILISKILNVSVISGIYKYWEKKCIFGLNEIKKNLISEQEN